MALDTATILAQIDDVLARARAAARQSLPVAALMPLKPLVVALRASSRRSIV
jgi:hypothetical protein